MAEQDPDPLEDYLRQWGLEMYSATFKEQTIDLEKLQMLSENDIKELVPMIGHKAKLNTQIKLLQSITALREESMSIEIISEDQSTEPNTSQGTRYVLQPVDETLYDLENIQQPDTNPDSSCILGLNELIMRVRHIREWWDMWLNQKYKMYGCFAADLINTIFVA